MSNNKNTLPKWFEGSKYEKGDTVKNPFSGEEFKLTASQLSMYDFIMGAQMTIEMGWDDEDILNDFHKGLDWFRETDANAYKILLNSETGSLIQKHIDNAYENNEQFAFPKEALTIIDKLTYVGEEKKIFNGYEIIETFDDGKPKKIVKYKDGKRTNEYKEYPFDFNK